MAAGIKSILSGIILSLFLGITSTGADTGNNQISDDEIIEYLVKDAAEKYSLLEKAIESCYEQRGINKIAIKPEQINKRFEEAGLTWKEATNAVLYIGERNEHLCFHEAKTNMVYAATAFQKVMTEQGREVRFEIEGDTYTFKDMIDMALFPLPDGYRLAISYGRLPVDIKDYMEQNFGRMPFDYMVVIDGMLPNFEK